MASVSLLSSYNKVSRTARGPLNTRRITHTFDNHIPNLREARNNALPLARPGVEFDIIQTPHTITFLRRVGLGFTRTLRDGIADDLSEADDLDAGRIASLTLDLDI